MTTVGKFKNANICILWIRKIKSIEFQTLISPQHSQLFNSFSDSNAQRSWTHATRRLWFPSVSKYYRIPQISLFLSYILTMVLQHPQQTSRATCPSYSSSTPIFRSVCHGPAYQSTKKKPIHNRVNQLNDLFHLKGSRAPILTFQSLKSRESERRSIWV